LQGLLLAAGLTSNRRLSANTEPTPLATLPAPPPDPPPRPSPAVTPSAITQQRPGGRGTARSHRQVGNRRLRSEDSAGWWPPPVGGVALARASASVWPHAGGLPLSVDAAASTAAATALSRERRDCRVVLMAVSINHSRSCKEQIKASKESRRAADKTAASWAPRGARSPPP